MDEFKKYLIKQDIKEFLSEFLKRIWKVLWVVVIIFLMFWLVNVMITNLQNPTVVCDPDYVSGGSCY